MGLGFRCWRRGASAGVFGEAGRDAVRLSRPQYPAGQSVAEAVGRLWEVVIREMGPESDFTSAIKPIEQAAGVVVGGKKSG